jgi:IS5 family transposase
MGARQAQNKAPVELTAPYNPEGRNGCPPFSLQAMLHTPCMQQWFTLSDPGMKEAFFDTPLYREFAQLDAFSRLPDEGSILRFRHRLEKHKLAEQILSAVHEILTGRGRLSKAGTAVDATLIAAHQAPVRLCQSALPGLEEEHGTTHHAICPVQLVDGAGQIDESTHMSAPENRARARQGAQKAQDGSKNDGVSGIKKASAAMLKLAWWWSPRQPRPS